MVPQVLVPVPLRRGGSKEVVQEHLILRSGAAFPADSSTCARLKRTVLRCLLLKSLQQRADGGFELHAVLAAQLGAAVAAAVSADAQQRALYRTEGHSLRELQDSLSSAGIIQVGYEGTAKYAAVRPEWIGAPAADGKPSTPPTPPRVPQPNVPPPPPPRVPLPTAATGRANGCTASGISDDAVNGMQTFVDIDILHYDRVMGGAQTSTSIAHVTHCFNTRVINRCMPGRDAKSQLHAFALGALLRLGLKRVEGVGGGRFKVEPVSSTPAHQLLLKSLPAHKGGAAALDCYRQQYSCSFHAVVTDPVCSQYVQVQGVSGQEHMLLLLLDRMAAPASGASGQVPTGQQAAPASASTARVLVVPKVGPSAQKAARAGSPAAPAAASKRTAPAEQGSGADVQRAQQAEQGRKAAEHHAQRAERERADLEGKLKEAEQGWKAALEQAQQQQREAGMARYAALERARVLQTERDAAERRADSAEASLHAEQQRARQAARERDAAREQAATARQQAAAAQRQAAACPAAEDPAAWLACAKRRSQLKMLLSIASMSGEFSQRDVRPRDAHQALAEAKQVLLSALRVADHSGTTAPRSRKEVQLARRAVHPDKFVTAPGLVQAAVGLASRVVGSAADFLEGHLA